MNYPPRKICTNCCEIGQSYLFIILFVCLLVLFFSVNVNFTIFMFKTRNSNLGETKIYNPIHNL